MLDIFAVVCSSCLIREWWANSLPYLARLISRVHSPPHCHPQNNHAIRRIDSTRIVTIVIHHDHPDYVLGPARHATWIPAILPYSIMRWIRFMARSSEFQWQRAAVSRQGITLMAHANDTVGAYRLVYGSAMAQRKALWACACAPCALDSKYLTPFWARDGYGQHSAA